ILEKIVNSLKSEKFEFVRYDRLPSEPTTDFINEGTTEFLQSGADIILAVGGGTPIDTAKGISVMITNPGSITDYITPNSIRKPGIPVIAVPATAGTGSEVTIYTVITDTETDNKLLFTSPYLMPEMAILDPLLTLTMPKSLTAATGLDALTHAIEAYVSVKSQPMTDLLALSAIELLSTNLLRAWDDGNNIDARENNILAAHQAGLAFGNASVALVHGMSRPIGAYFHIAHGVSNAVLLGPVTEFSISGNYRRYADIAEAMGIDTNGLDEPEAAKAAATAIRFLIKNLEIPTLIELGVDKTRFLEVIPEMVEAAIASGSPANNPRLATKEEIAGIYRELVA
ncbi:MAG TPA: iron-containing alcohol dehydrogenase, partial [Dehalococcoidia bacterium]|nr:iron-containing alcohol dehydrogenase [Dehalococcoidia bacterium]